MAQRNGECPAMDYETVIMQWSDVSLTQISNPTVKKMSDQKCKHQIGNSNRRLHRQIGTSDRKFSQVRISDRIFQLASQVHVCVPNVEIMHEMSCF